MRSECVHEPEVLDAVAAGRWPDRLGHNLKEHVENCEVCSDLAFVAQSFKEDPLARVEHSRIPSAGLVWWRAELRARQEAIRVASRPITLVQILAGAGGLAVAAGLLSRVDLSTLLGFDLMSWLEALPESAAALYLVLSSIGLVLIVAGVAAFVLLADE